MRQPLGRHRRGPGIGVGSGAEGPESGDPFGDGAATASEETLVDGARAVAVEREGLADALLELGRIHRVASLLASGDLDALAAVEVERDAEVDFTDARSS